MSTHACTRNATSTSASTSATTHQSKLNVGDDVLVKCGADKKTTYQAKVISFKNKEDDDENKNEVEVKYTVQGTKEFVHMKWVSFIDPNSGRPKRNSRQTNRLSLNHLVHGCTKTYDDDMSNRNSYNNTSDSNSNSSSKSIIIERKPLRSKRGKRLTKTTFNTTTKKTSKPRYKEDVDIGLDSSSESETKTKINRRGSGRVQQLRTNNRGTTSMSRSKRSSSSMRRYKKDADIGLDSTSSDSETETAKTTTKNHKLAYTRSTSQKKIKKNHSDSDFYLDSNSSTESEGRRKVVRNKISKTSNRRKQRSIKQRRSSSNDVSDSSHLDSDVYENSDSDSDAGADKRVHNDSSDDNANKGNSDEGGSFGEESSIEDSSDDYVTPKQKNKKRQRRHIDRPKRAMKRPNFFMGPAEAFANDFRTSLYDTDRDDNDRNCCNDNYLDDDDDDSGGGGGDISNHSDRDFDIGGKTSTNKSAIKIKREVDQEVITIKPSRVLHKRSNDVDESDESSDGDIIEITVKRKSSKKQKKTLSLDRQKNITADYDSPGDNPRITGQVPIIQSSEEITDSGQGKLGREDITNKKNPITTSSSLSQITAVITSSPTDIVDTIPFKKIGAIDKSDDGNLVHGENETNYRVRLNSTASSSRNDAPVATIPNSTVATTLSLVENTNDGHNEDIEVINDNRLSTEIENEITSIDNILVIPGSPLYGAVVATLTSNNVSNISSHAENKNDDDEDDNLFSDDDENEIINNRKNPVVSVTLRNKQVNTPINNTVVATSSLVENRNNNDDIDDDGNNFSLEEENKTKNKNVESITTLSSTNAPVDTFPSNIVKNVPSLIENKDNDNTSLFSDVNENDLLANEGENETTNNKKSLVVSGSLRNTPIDRTLVSNIAVTASSPTENKNNGDNSDINKFTGENENILSREKGENKMNNNKENPVILGASSSNVQVVTLINHMPVDTSSLIQNRDNDENNNNDLTTDKDNNEATYNEKDPVIP